jgi:hypothetical protein
MGSPSILLLDRSTVDLAGGSGKTPCRACDDPPMVEYGNGIGQVSGQAGGGTAGQQMDAGAAFGQFVSNTVHTVSTMPPAQLVLLGVIVIIGLLILKRAF